jgi:hypothetical protein
MRGVGDLVPDNWRQIVESKRPAMLLDGGVQRYNCMSATVLSTRQAHVSDNTHQPTAGDESPEAVPPNFVELCQELFIFLNMAHLPI